MITVEPITAQNVGLFKTVRLRALQDAPYAFSATYAKESQFDEAEWSRRVERMNGERGIGFLAMDGGNACGIVGAFLDLNDATRVQLVSMWTAPAYRRRGVGRLLVNEESLFLLSDHSILRGSMLGFTVPRVQWTDGLFA